MKSDNNDDHTKNDTKNAGVAALGGFQGFGGMRADPGLRSHFIRARKSETVSALCFDWGCLVPARRCNGMMCSFTCTSEDV